MSGEHGSLRLRPMNEAELEDYLTDATEAYIADRIETGEPEDVARSTGTRQLEAYFPEGRPAPGHEVLVLERDDARVGIVWIGPHPGRPGDAAAAWIFDIEIDTASRGAGLGRAALALTQEHVSRSGVSTLALNVFGGNEIARNLYRSAGFVETFVTMSKTLPSDADGGGTG